MKKKTLLNIEPPKDEPEDLQFFWSKNYDDSFSLSSDVELNPIWSPSADIQIYEVSYKSFENCKIGGWIVRPKQSIGGIVFGHGYGGRDWFDLNYAEKGFTCIYPCIRGFNKSASQFYPWKSDKHVLHGIENKETYILKGAAYDIYQATSVLLKLYPDIKKNLNYFGSSFGGGLGALAIPWDKRFKSAYLHVPTFGHHPLRLQKKSKGSSESVRQYAHHHPEVINVLKYYDAAVTAQYFKIPVLCAIAFKDEYVLPEGQFAIANGIPKELSQKFLLPVGHASFRGENKVLRILNNKILELFSSNR